MILEKKMEIKRGEIWDVDFGKADKDKPTSKQLGVRPALVLQNDTGNKFSSTVVVIPLSTQMHKAKLPTHVIFKPEDGLKRPSFSMAEQIQTVDKSDFIKNVSVVTEETMLKVAFSMFTELGFLEFVDTRALKQLQAC